MLSDVIAMYTDLLGRPPFQSPDVTPFVLVKYQVVDIKDNRFAKLIGPFNEALHSHPVRDTVQEETLVGVQHCIAVDLVKISHIGRKSVGLQLFGVMFATITKRVAGTTAENET